MLTENQRTHGQYKYLPAVLRENDSDWYIEYYAEHPQTHKMTRFRQRMNRAIKRFSRKSDARKYCLDVVSKINAKFLDGWNPFFQGEDSRLYTPINEVMERYLKDKKKELRPTSYTAYLYFSRSLLGWIAESEPNLFCSLFNVSKAVRFMDYMYEVRGVNSRTYNNFLRLAKCFFSWALEKQYTKENPFASIKSKRNEKKERVVIDADTRKRIADYLAGKPFLLVCMLCYHSLIRPREIRNLRIKDIDLAKHCIHINGKIAKNHNSRIAAISTQIESLINDLGIMNHNENFYVFSDPTTLSPGSQILYDMRFSHEWIKLRKAIGLPMKMQLYSLRDTGIFSMLKSHVDDLSVMQHADHSSLDITTIYANHYDPNLVKIINENTPEF